MTKKHRANVIDYESSVYFLRVYLSTRLDLIHCIVLFNFIISVTSILNCRIIILTYTFLMNYPLFWLILNKTCLQKKVCEYFNSNLHKFSRETKTQPDRETEEQRDKDQRGNPEWLGEDPRATQYQGSWGNVFWMESMHRKIYQHLHHYCYDG